MSSKVGWLTFIFGVLLYTLIVAFFISDRRINNDVIIPTITDNSPELIWKIDYSTNFIVSYPPSWKFEFINRNNGPEFDDMSEVKVSKPEVGSVSFYNFVSHGPMGDFKDTSVVFGGHTVSANERIMSKNETWTLSGDVHLSDTKVPIFIAQLNDKGRNPTDEERKTLLRIVSDVEFK